eukprot:scaffold4481_cov121-Cylindrotheca_fusiformis.AAC.10
MKSAVGSKRHRFRLLTRVAVVLLMLAVAVMSSIIFLNNKDRDLLSTLNIGTEEMSIVDEARIIGELKERLQPKELTFQEHNNSTVALHKFLHLHNMKTGGTSMDHRLRCAMNRLRKDQEVSIQYGSIHECAPRRYYDCRYVVFQQGNRSQVPNLRRNSPSGCYLFYFVARSRDGKNPSCNKRLADSSFMSYCAPLKDLKAFEWDATKDDIDAITVLRDPVDRVWSMFRFQTKGCYKWYVA